MALHMRIHDFGREALMLIGEEPVTLELWEQLLDQIVGEMLAQRKLFLMHERNQAVMEKLHREDHDAEHEDIQNQFRRVLGDERVPVRDRVRMAAAFGVVFSSIFLGDVVLRFGDQGRIGGHAPRHPPRRPARMTGPVRRAKTQPSWLQFVSVTDAPSSGRAPRAPLHDRHRRGRHRPEGRRPRQGRCGRGGAGAGAHDLSHAAPRVGPHTDEARGQAARGGPGVVRLPRHGPPGTRPQRTTLRPREGPGHQDRSPAVRGLVGLRPGGRPQPSPSASRAGSPTTPTSRAWPSCRARASRR